MTGMSAIADCRQQHPGWQAGSLQASSKEKRRQRDEVSRSGAPGASDDSATADLCMRCSTTAVQARHVCCCCCCEIQVGRLEGKVVLSVDPEWTCKMAVREEPWKGLFVVMWNSSSKFNHPTALHCLFASRCDTPRTLWNGGRHERFDCHHCRDRPTKSSFPIQWTEHPNLAVGNCLRFG